MKKVSPGCCLLFLVATVFTLATLVVPRAANWNGQSSADNGFQLLLGEGRKLFANQFFIMGDVYFHSGFYPSMFDRREDQPDVAAPAHGLTDEDSTSEDFRGPPKDWLDRFARRFELNKHTHLDSGGASGKLGSGSIREILPWLRLSTDMNPQMVESYTVAAYWLRKALKQPHEAEDFLHEGLRNNPDSYELWFDLGRLYNEDYHDAVRARNVWEVALRKWHQSQDGQKAPDFPGLHAITADLGHLEAQNGNYVKAIDWLEMTKTNAPAPDSVQHEIDELKQKLAAQSLVASTNAVH